MSEAIADLKRTSPKSKNKTLKLTLPVPPSVNSIYVNTRYGGKRLSKKAEDYVRVARALVNDFVEKQHWQRAVIGQWLYADMTFFFPDKRRRDSHNGLKILLDALESIVYEDDMYVLPRIQGAEYDKKNPRVEIRFTYQTKNSREKALSI